MNGIFILIIGMMCMEIYIHRGGRIAIIPYREILFTPSTKTVEKNIKLKKKIVKIFKIILLIYVLKFTFNMGSVFYMPYSGRSFFEYMKMYVDTANRKTYEESLVNFKNYWSEIDEILSKYGIEKGEIQNSYDEYNNGDFWGYGEYSVFYVNNYKISIELVNHRGIETFDLSVEKEFEINSLSDIYNTRIMPDEFEYIFEIGLYLTDYIINAYKATIVAYDAENRTYTFKYEDLEYDDSGFMEFRAYNPLNFWEDIEIYYETTSSIYSGTFSKFGFCGKILRNT